MFRISITYPATAGATFDWNYYMNNHLPLAVGTSMRHSSLNFCDADRPINPVTPHAAVCMVHFESESGMQDFCDFFAEGHPDSEKIGADEINYTTIKPGMTAGECELSGEPRDSGHRLKIFFPQVEGLQLSRQDVREAQTKILKDIAPISSAETDYCRSGLVKNSAPDYSIIWTLYLDDRDQALVLEPDLSSLEALCQANAQVMVSEVMPFDLDLTAPYR